MLLEGLRNSDDYRALKQILKARGERIWENSGKIQN
jgi:hypothetical protein